MNNRQNNRRRGRGGGPRPNGVNAGNDRGNRIDNRARGNANQLFEKYKTLARDAQMQGDRVMAEYYFQFADHYFRVLNESRSRFEDQRRGRDDQMDRDEQDDYSDDNEGFAEPGNRSFEANTTYAVGQQRARSTEADEQRPEASENYRGNGHGSEDRPASEAPRYADSNGRDEGETPRQGRGRRPRQRDAAPAMIEDDGEGERIEIDRLPPALSAQDGQSDEAQAEKPRRRGRRPNVESSVAEA